MEAGSCQKHIVAKGVKPAVSWANSDARKALCGSFRRVLAPL